MLNTTNTINLATLVADIGMDLDGCSCDFVTAHGDFAAIDTGRPRHEFAPAKRWNYMLDWGFTIPEYLAQFARGVKAGHILAKAPLYEKAVEGWQMLLDAGHRIHVVTDRRPPGAEVEALDATKSWLADNGLHHESLTIDADKTVINEIAAGPVVVALDDKAEHYVALTDAGVEAFLMDRPWNQHVPNARRVTDLVDFAHQVNALCVRPPHKEQRP